MTLDDPAEGYIRFHQVVFELRGKLTDGCIGYRIDQHISTCCSLDRDNPVIDQITLLCSETFCGGRISTNDLLHQCFYYDRVPGNCFQDLCNRSIGTQKEFLYGRASSDLQFNLVQTRAMSIRAISTLLLTRIRLQVDTIISGIAIPSFLFARQCRVTGIGEL